MKARETWLCLDLGNSRLKAQLRAGDEGGELRILAEATAENWALRLADLADAAEGRAALCSVRPSRAVPLVAALERAGTSVHTVDGETPAPFPVDLRGRSTLGADRLCNAAAAWSLGLVPALILDAGTAVTADVLDAAARYRGGAILPGAELVLDALARGGERLFAAPADWPPSPWGEDSAAALAAGALWGGLAALEGLAERFREDFGAEGWIVLTGGAAGALAERWRGPAPRLEPDWTLRGLHALVSVR